MVLKLSCKEQEETWQQKSNNYGLIPIMTLKKKSYILNLLCIIRVGMQPEKEMTNSQIGYEVISTLFIDVGEGGQVEEERSVILCFLNDIPVRVW